MLDFPGNNLAQDTSLAFLADENAAEHKNCLFPQNKAKPKMLL